MPTLNVIVVTPEQTALETQAEFVALPLYDGEIGIGVNHAPMIGRLGFGEMRVRNVGGETRSFYVDGGFVQVADNTVSVLTGTATPAARINLASAEAQLAEATKSPAGTDELAAVREKHIAQARGQIRTARKAR